VISLRTIRNAGDSIQELFQISSGTILMAPQGHSDTQMPHPLQ
jgi:hypothetical protein